MRTAALLLLSTLLASATSAQYKALDALQGTWKITAIEMEGTRMESEAFFDAKWIIQGNRLSLNTTAYGESKK